MTLAVRAILITICLVPVFTGPAQAVTRDPIVSGTFYPADSLGLARKVQGHLSNVDRVPQVEGDLLALIVPHAGLDCSGQTAAYAYTLLKNSKIDKVILCGPSHRLRFDGISVYGPEVTWKTPLGTVESNLELCSTLIEKNDQIGFIPQAHTQEHSLEVQLPYLQEVLDRFAIIPVVMGGQDRSTISLLADALTSLKPDDRTIMIASTDWQHYRPATQGWPMDSLGIACLRQLDVECLERLIQGGAVEACGGGPAVAVLSAAVAMGANKCVILKYSDSGDSCGDKDRVVGYVAAAIYRTGDEMPDKEHRNDDPEPESNDSDEYELSPSDRETLLKIARQSIDARLNGRDIPVFDVPDHLREPGAAFVTLEQQGRLRGCIGHTIAVKPLFETVSYCGIQAAVADPRFPPVKAGELDGLDIEISVLTPLQEITSLDEIEVGRDGLMIQKGYNRGLLLPQVATEYGWNRTEFLEHTCRKAGLPLGAYKSADATIYKFQAIIFGEKDAH